jgi:SAM-dependent methyltransferase
VSRNCRSCNATLEHSVIDLGEQPLANSYPTVDELNEGVEARYPLHALVCTKCWLMQVDDVVDAGEIFSEYPYFSSYSTSWLDHCAAFARAATKRFALSDASRVVEVASNDGYLLQFFRNAGIPVLGVEPAANVAAAAEAAGIDTRIGFFGTALAEELVADGGQADLVVANNVLAHVPDLNDFVAGLARLVAPTGAVVIEVPHLLRMLERCEFDTIYHEHFSYFSLIAAITVLQRHGLEIVDVEELATHGGSLRIFAQRDGGPSAAVANVVSRERAAGLESTRGYEQLAADAGRVREELVVFLECCRRDGRRVAAYGAAAKGNTLLNWCGVTTKDIAYVADRNPYKQQRVLPGSHLPIVDPETLLANAPDDVLILPWNLREEILVDLESLRPRTRFFVAIPCLQEAT